MRDLFFLFGWGSVGWGDLIRSISSFQWPCRSFGLVSLRSLPWHLCRRSLVLVFPSVWSFRVGLVVPLFLSCCWSRPPVGFVVPLALSFLLTFSFLVTFSFRTRRSFRIVPSVSSFCRSRRSVGTGRVCAYSQHNLVSSSLHGLTAEAEHAQGMMHFPKASNVNCAGEVFC